MTDINIGISLEVGSVYVCVCMLSHFSPFQLCVTLWTIACQGSLFIGFSRQKYWSGLPGDLPNPGTEPISLMAGGFFTTNATWEAQANLSGEFRIKHLCNSKYLAWQHGVVESTLNSESEVLVLRPVRPQVNHDQVTYVLRASVSETWGCFTHGNMVFHHVHRMEKW